jgi:hypothetical membrane protein
MRNQRCPGYQGSVTSARAAAVVWLVGATVYLVCEAVAAAGTPGYSYTGDYISDLGRTAVMNTGAFAAHGMLFLLGAFFAARGPTPALSGRGFVAAAAVNALGNMVVAVVPSHVHTAVPWHGMGAALAIIGGNIAVILGGRSSRHRGYRRLSVVLGVVGIAGLVAVVSGAQPAGLVERGSVYPIIAWELASAALLLRHGTRL